MRPPKLARAAFAAAFAFAGAAHAAVFLVNNNGDGAVGVLVRDVPAPDPNRLLHALAALQDEGIELRIAYLREGGQAAASEAGFDGNVFST